MLSIWQLHETVLGLVSVWINFFFFWFLEQLDERILEYDIDKVLFDGRSPFQKVQIVHSKSLGNMLVLDELQSEYIILHSTHSPYYNYDVVFP